VTPREAEVYVDGYLAGTVDDYDGIFQRLHLRPGSHEIALYLEGYRTIRQSLYFNPSMTQKVTYTLERLAAGEMSEPPPAPAPESPAVDSQLPPRAPVPVPGPRPAPRQAETDFGALAIRVQPAGAEILIDGEPLSAPEGQGRIVIRLAPGRHRVEVRLEGFARYAEDVLIRSGRTLTLNVSLLQAGPDAR
jgi:hypothetical protein